MKVLTLLLCFVCTCVHGATFTLVNKCDFTVWPGILASADCSKLDSTGFELPVGDSRSFPAPPGWSGRFWARTGCNFDDQGHGSCAVGDCGSGQVECNGAGAVPPATLAEFTIGSGAPGSQDFYDVSMVDGYNLPVVVHTTSGSGSCATTGCATDVNRRCPEELRAAGAHAMLARAHAMLSGRRRIAAAAPTDRRTRVNRRSTRWYSRRLAPNPTATLTMTLRALLLVQL